MEQLAPATISEWIAPVDDRVVQIAASLGLHPGQFDATRIRAIVDQAGRNSQTSSLESSIVSALTIAETHFLRHRMDFEWIVQQWLPGWIERAEHGRMRIDILSAGCSTGEEPYTLYALLRQPLSKEWDLAVTGIDINETSLNVARQAMYGLWSLRGVLPSEVDAWLHPEGGRWRVIEAVKRGVSFQTHNLMNPFDGPDLFDLALFRNVSIYFHESAIATAWANLVHALRPNGVVVVGPSDPVPPQSLNLTLEWHGDVRTYRKSGTRPRPPAAGATTPPARSRNEPNAAIPLPAAGPAPTRPAPEPLDEYHLVAALAARGDRETAWRLAIEHSKQEPLRVDWHLLAAYLSAELNRTDLAAESMRRALYLSPQQPFVAYMSGVMLDQGGRAAEARQRFNWAMELLATMADESFPAHADGMTVRQMKELIHARIVAAHH